MGVTVAPFTLELDDADEASHDARCRALYVDLGAPVRGFLAGMVGAGGADDALQETFTRAFAQRALPPRGEVRPWLYGIARNVAREALRASRRAPLAAADPVEPPGRGPCPESAAIAREAAARVRRAMDALPEDRRAALLLRVQQGLSCDEIAAAMDWTVAKVKIEVHRARLALRSAAEGGDHA